MKTAYPYEDDEQMTMLQCVQFGNLKGYGTDDEATKMLDEAIMHSSAKLVRVWPYDEFGIQKKAYHGMVSNDDYCEPSILIAFFFDDELYTTISYTESVPVEDKLEIEALGYKNARAIYRELGPWHGTVRTDSHWKIDARLQELDAKGISHED